MKRNPDGGTTLKSWAVSALVESRMATSVLRGISSRKKGADLSIVKGKDISIERYRLEKFKYRLRPSHDCIVCDMPNILGYCTVTVAKKVNLLAHRFTYRLFVGPIAKGMVIDHICRNRACVNVDHLRMVTQQENILCGVGATATHAKKTHCIRGHEFNKENTYKIPKGRNCRICRRIAKKRWDMENEVRIKKYRAKRHKNTGRW